MFFPQGPILIPAVEGISLTVSLKKEAIYSHTQPFEIQVARLEMLLEVSRKLHATLDLDNLFLSLIEVAMQLTDAEAAAVLLLKEQADSAFFEVITREKQVETSRAIAPLEGSIAGWIVHTGEPLVMDNLPEFTRRFGQADHLSQREVRTILGVPLKAQAKVIGVLEVFNKHHSAGFTGDDIHLLSTLAGQAAIAIKNARLFRQEDPLARLIQVLSGPITTIFDTSQGALADPEATLETLRARLQTIGHEAEGLTELLNHFLDLAQLETGRSRLERQLLDLRTLTQEVMAVYAPQIRQKGFSLSWHAPAMLPLIPGDARRLKQVMTHLLDNAIRFNGDKGRIKISISCSPVRILWSIRDTGQGIPPEELGFIFDKFHRGRDEQSLSIRPGLGLPTARKIIEAHGGDLWAESEVGAGSTFSFSLPLRG